MDMIFSYLQDAMIELVLATVCAVIALVAVWKVVGDLFGSRGKGKCSWSKDPLQPNDGMVRWICASCGAFAFGQGNAAPATCQMNQPKQTL